MNYFELFGLQPSLKIDEEALKKLYFQKSKEVHPDFYTLDSEEAQEAMLEASTRLNKAYKVLSNFDSRLQYALEEQGMLAEEGQNKLPESFLMEMMDLNEALMELEFDFDQQQYDLAKAKLRESEESLLASIQAYAEADDLRNLELTDWEVLKNFHLKKRYLLRIHENLRKFASAS
jgi:molecular chaperone HscB